MSIKGAEGLAGAVLGIGGGLAVCSVLHAADAAGAHIGRVVLEAQVAASARAQVRAKAAARRLASAQLLATYNASLRR